MHKITTVKEFEYHEGLMVKETTVVIHEDPLDLMRKEYENPSKLLELLGQEREKRTKEKEEASVYEDAYSIAMKTVIDKLKKNKLPGSNYYAWQSNIAMAIEDTFPQHWQAFSDLQIPKMANDAAKIFLENLIR